MIDLILKFVWICFRDEKPTAMSELQHNQILTAFVYVINSYNHGLLYSSSPCYNCTKIIQNNLNLFGAKNPMILSEQKKDQILTAIVTSLVLICIQYSPKNT